jgi:hypothetical protein
MIVGSVGVVSRIGSPLRGARSVAGGVHRGAFVASGSQL